MDPPSPGVSCRVVNHYYENTDIPNCLRSGGENDLVLGN